MKDQTTWRYENDGSVDQQVDTIRDGVAVFNKMHDLFPQNWTYAEC